MQWRGSAPFGADIGVNVPCILLGDPERAGKIVRRHIVIEGPERQIHLLIR